MLHAVEHAPPCVERDADPLPLGSHDGIGSETSQGMGPAARSRRNGDDGAIALHFEDERTVRGRSPGLADFADPMSLEVSLGSPRCRENHTLIGGRHMKSRTIRMFARSTL